MYSFIVIVIHFKIKKLAVFRVQLAARFQLAVFRVQLAVLGLPSYEV